MSGVDKFLVFEIGHLILVDVKRIEMNLVLRMLVLVEGLDGADFKVGVLRVGAVGPHNEFAGGNQHHGLVIHFGNLLGRQSIRRHFTSGQNRNRDKKYVEDALIIHKHSEEP